MKTINTGFRLFEDAPARLKALALPGESVARTFDRCLTALEAAPTTPVSDTLGKRFDSLAWRNDEMWVMIQEMKDRLTNVEQVLDSQTVVEQVLSCMTPDEQVLDSQTVVEQLPNDSTQDSESRRTRFSYSEDTKRMAVNLLRSNPDITIAAMDAAIFSHCGHSTGRGNAIRAAKKWAASLPE